MLVASQHGGASMAFWQKKGKDFEKMDELVQRNPGISLAELARQLGVERSTVTRRLPSVEDAGYLYYEDEQGGLWPFKRRK
jgi:DNA-binding MarR family transcriptional regulator